MMCTEKAHITTSSHCVSYGYLYCIHSSWQVYPCLVKWFSILRITCHHIESKYNSCMTKMLSWRIFVYFAHRSNFLACLPSTFQLFSRKQRSDKSLWELIPSVYLRNSSTNSYLVVDIPTNLNTWKKCRNCWYSKIMSPVDLLYGKVS